MHSVKKDPFSEGDLRAGKQKRGHKGYLPRGTCRIIYQGFQKLSWISFIFLLSTKTKDVFVFWTIHLGGVKRKRAFKHAPNAQIQIILRMRKVPSGPLLTFIHSVVSNDPGSGHWKPCPHMPAYTRFRMARPI